MPCTLYRPPFAPSPHFALQLSAMLDHDARIVKAGALVPLCKMLLSSIVTTQEYTSGLLRNLVAYNAGACCLLPLPIPLLTPPSQT